MHKFLTLAALAFMLMAASCSNSAQQVVDMVKQNCGILVSVADVAGALSAQNPGVVGIDAVAHAICNQYQNPSLKPAASAGMLVFVQRQAEGREQGLCRGGERRVHPQGRQGEIAMLEVGTFLLAQAATAPPPPTEVTIPWGNWIVQVLDVLQPMLLIALTGVTTYIMAAFVPPWIKAFAGQAAQNRINQVLEKAVLSGIAQTKEAVTGQRTTIPIASDILARAAQYAVDQAPDLVKHATNGEVDNLLKMILARMEQLNVAPADFDIHAARTAPTFPVDIQKQLGK